MGASSLLSAESNQTATAPQTKAQKQLQAQMEREKKFAQEQQFYQGVNYDLSYAEVDPDSLENIKVPEPEYDFDMDDVYD